MAKKVVVDFELKYKEAVANLNEFQKEYAKLEKQTQKTNEGLEGLTAKVDQLTGGAITKFGNFKNSIGGVTKGFKSLRVAIIATGIGALIVAITSVTAAFKASEEGQNKFTKFFTQIKVVIGNVTDLLADFGMAIINVFSGNFKEAKKNIDAVVDGIKNFGEETKKEIKAAGELADARAKADKQERELLVERAEASRKVAELREKAADKENVTAAERIKALEEASRIEQEITNKEIENARLRFEAKKAENALSKSTKEDLDEEAALQAEVIRLETARLKLQKSLTAEITTAKREQTAETTKAANEEKKKEKEIADFKLKIRDAEATSEAEKRELELIKIDEQYAALIEKAKEFGLATDELEDAQREAKKEKQAEFDAQDKERKDKIAAEDAAREQEKIDKETALEEKRKQLREDNFNNAVKLAGEETKLGKALLLAKQILLAKEFIMDAKAQIAKAKEAVSTATINAAEASTETTSSVAKAANTAPPPFNIPFILTAIATGASVLSAVKAAVGATKSAAATVGASGGSASIETAPITPASSPPAFNVVGQGGASQLAAAIGGQPPVRAFVVSNDVTTAQGLERNTIEGATIG